MKENVIESRSKSFAVRVVRLYQFLANEQKEFVLSKQLLRAGTSIGANIREGIQGFSRNDFVYRMSIALKECNETCYWLELLHETNYLSPSQFESIYADAKELLKMLTAIVKTTKAAEPNLK